MEWFSGSIPEAVAEAKKNNKLFLVYIEGSDDMSKAMTNTYNDAAVAQKLSSSDVVALKLASNSVPYIQFCAIYPVLIIPSSYFIGVNGAPIEIVTGSLVPSEFAAKIDKIFETHRNATVKKDATPQPSSSTEPEPCVSNKENAADLAQPSTSKVSEEENQPPLEERVARAKALLEAKKQIEEQEELEKAKKEELERRSVGKALQKVQQQRGDNELQEWARNRAKEKEEERLAREKVRAMIAQDRAERAARYQQTKEMEQAERERQAKLKEEQARTARSAAINSNQAHIQFRLPDGSSTTHVFSADATLDDAKKFVINDVRPPFSSFSLCTTFPRRQFTTSNYSESLRDLQLAPSAVVLILPEQTVSNVYSGGSFFTNIFWMLLSPFTAVWRLITSFFPRTTQNNEQPSPPNSEPSNNSPNNQTENSNNQSGVRRRDTSFLRRDGNIYRINNQSDDDENNTWNGNSTQQM